MTYPGVDTFISGNTYILMSVWHLYLCIRPSEAYKIRWFPFFCYTQISFYSKFRIKNVCHGSIYLCYGFSTLNFTSHFICLLFGCPCFSFNFVYMAFCSCHVFFLFLFCFLLPFDCYYCCCYQWHWERLAGFIFFLVIFGCLSPNVFCNSFRSAWNAWNNP